MNSEATLAHDEEPHEAGCPSPHKGPQRNEEAFVASSTPTDDGNHRPTRKGNRAVHQVQSRYMDIERSTNYVRNRNEQLKRRRELEKRNSDRAIERMQQTRATSALKDNQEQIYRKWLQDSNADAHRLQNPAKDALLRIKPSLVKSVSSKAA
ncbi:hypothetical protein H310_03521 [Aphanomyces invadans]|uniref:Uncharacterized protein n=1 Tax=Aphanomyces invadans TaxID=157072 RepID=A0A024UJS4_9STRA|nr:hypothetical protein H310_03521 [Aphanomyces invadans]ETW05863.1 hypothetical protein H310_03521 [Aphanomyces invadans]|eukprot:XP_008865640.1 hypothetical protein H310_03521 [Aphanomyces invadans]